MSEYQYIHFLAIDRPLDDKHLEFMRRQSTRADITQWEFTNEYHFGDFHGNACEMLRHGYDVHLHYANFGMRKLMMRLPEGLPCDRRTFDAFLPEVGVTWYADKKGKGGILEIEPDADAGSYDEDIFDIDPLLRKIAPVRDALIAGDLRPLYLAWLACNGDDEAREPPVPAGLGTLTPALRAVAKFYEVSRDLIAAAARQSPPMPKSTDADDTLKKWIVKQSAKDLRELTERLLGKDAAAARAETLSSIRSATPTAAWPMAEPTRTLAQLVEAATGQGDRRMQKEQAARDADRRKRLAAIAADPDKVIANVKELVKLRSVESYRQAAEELADLSEALGPKVGPARARAVAEKLRRENPRLHRLIAALRKQDLLE